MSNSKLSRKDWFAGLAMQGMLASQDARNDGKGTGIVNMKDKINMLEFAEQCYDIADAMEQVRK